MPKRKRKSTPLALKIFHWIVVIGSWIALVSIIITVRPSTWAEIYYAPLFALLYIALASTIGLITRRWAVILILPLAIVGLFLLRLFGFYDWYYAASLVGMCATLIYFFTVTDRSGKVSAKTSKEQSAEE